MINSQWATAQTETVQSVKGMNAWNRLAFSNTISVINNKITCLSRFNQHQVTKYFKLQKHFTYIPENLYEAQMSQTKHLTKGTP